MDLQEFWQENKRWVLGVIAGAIVFWIGASVVENLFGADGTLRKAQIAKRDIESNARFDAAGLKQLRAENEKLVAMTTRLRERVGFVPDDDFVLAGKGDPDTYFPEIARRVRRRILQTAQENTVEFADANLSWLPAVGREEIANRLLELNVLEQAAMRLLDASVEVRASEPDAFGLYAIDAIRIEKPRGSRAARGRGRSSTPEPVDEYTVTFQFRCDVATLQSWLERLRAQRPALGVAAEPPVTIQTGDQIGDPIRVKCAVQAIVIRES